MALEKELETYRQKLSELLADAGKYVVIHGEDVKGTYTSYEDAIQAGYETYGLKPFLVKRIEVDETIQCFTRDMCI